MPSLAVAAQECVHGRIELIHAAPRGVEHAPAALVHRVLLHAPLHQRGPVHRLQIDVHADPLVEVVGTSAIALVEGMSIGPSNTTRSPL